MVLWSQRIRPPSRILHKITSRLISVFETNMYNKSRSIHKVNILRNLLMQIQEQVQDFSLAFMRLNMLTLHRPSLSFYLVQGQGNGSQSGGAMEQWQVLSVSMVGREEKILNSRCYRMVKTVTFWAWWQPFNSFCFECLSFFLCFPFFFLLAKKWRGHVLPPFPLTSPVSPALFLSNTSFETDMKQVGIKTNCNSFSITIPNK